MTAASGVVTVTLNPALDQTLDCPGFALGAVNRAVGQSIHAGGKGINVAAFLAGRVGPVTATGFLGADNAGPFDALLASHGVRDRCVRLPGATRVNVKVVDRDSQQVTDINLPGLAISDEALVRLGAELEVLAADHAWFVLTGSVPPGVPDGVYAELTRRLHARGARVAVDASGAPLREAIAARPDLIKPNLAELGELLGAPVAGRSAALVAARALQRGGVAVVAVSMGEGGAILVDGERAVWAAAPAVEVASTVGAGDALLAGILAGGIAGGDLEACARIGAAFAAGTLSQIGPLLPPDERLAALAQAVRIERLEPAP